MNYQPTVGDYTDKNQAARLQDERELRCRVAWLEKEVDRLSNLLSLTIQCAATHDFDLLERIERIEESQVNSEAVEGESFVILFGND